jgi:hypothetical protein
LECDQIGFEGVQPAGQIGDFTFTTLDLIDQMLPLRDSGGIGQQSIRQEIRCHDLFAIQVQQPLRMASRPAADRFSIWLSTQLSGHQSPARFSLLSQLDQGRAVAVVVITIEPGELFAGGCEAGGCIFDARAGLIS